MKRNKLLILLLIVSMFAASLPASAKADAVEQSGESSVYMSDVTDGDTSETAVDPEPSAEVTAEPVPADAAEPEGMQEIITKPTSEPTSDIIEGADDPIQADTAAVTDDASELAETDTAELYASEGGFADRNRMSDEEFFGKWNPGTETWELEPKFDYSYNSDMEIIGECVKQGDYEEAKECLLHYYRNKDVKPALPTSRSSLEARVSMEGIHKFESPVAGLLSVGTKPAWYSVNVTSLVQSNVSCFLIHSVKRESTTNNMEEIVSFNSKESGENAPYLEIQQGNKITNIPVSQDMYIRGGDFAGENYGTETTLLVSEGGAAPSDNGTRQTHIRFDLSQLDLSDAITRATLRIYGSSTAENKEVAVFSGVENSWEENIITYSNMPIRVASWNNIDGGYNWEQISGLHAQFYNVQIRLNHVPTMFAEYFATRDESYARAGIEQVLDFIGDNGGLLYDLYTKEAALNAAFRGDPQLPSIFAGMLECDGITDANAITSVLKLIYQDATGLSMPKNEWRKHNGQAYQINSLLRYIAYFPEFVDRNSWVGNIDRRVMELSEDLLFEDGGYTEPTSGYDAGVLGTFTGLFNLAEIADIELPEEFMDIYEKFALAEMNLTMPNGVQWGWGDGGPSAMRQRIYDAAEIIGNDYMYYFGTLGSEDQKGTVPNWTSYFLPESKLGVMRNNWSENGIAAFFRGRTGLSHSHADVNQMLLYAYGRYLLADTGMNSYDARDPWYTWQASRTESHNTVEINETGQEKSGNVYTTMYTNPRMDFYTGESHAYQDFTHTRKAVFAKNDKFFIVSDYMEAPDDGSVNTFNQTWHNLVEAKPSLDETTGIAQTNYTSGANLEIVPVDPSKLTSATLDDGVGLNESNSVRNTSAKKHVSYKIKTAGNAIMNTILYPFEGAVTAQVQTTPISVSDNADNSAAAFSMVLPDGTKAEYYVNFRPEKIRRFDWYDVDAENVYIKYNKKDELEFFSASNINFIRQNGKDFMSCSTKLTDISASFEGRVANIQTTQDIDLSEDYIVIYAPNVVKATLNDEPVEFRRMGDVIVLGDYYLEFNAVTDENGNKCGTVKNDIEIGFTITVGGEEKNASLIIYEGTVITGGADWDGIIKIPEIKSSGADIGTQNFGMIDLGDFEVSKPVCVVVPAERGRAAIVSGDKIIKPETELDKNSKEEAFKKVTADNSAYFDDDDVSYNYLLSIKDIALYSDEEEPSVTPTKRPSQGGGSGGGTGGSGGGGSHYWPEQPTATPAPTEQPDDPDNPNDPSDESSFEDIKGHWAEADINAMFEKGFVNGKSETLFDPDSNITRAEFTAMAVRLLRIEQKGLESSFTDVNESDWYFDAVNSAAEKGIVNGFGAEFYPNKTLTRGEMAKILMGVCDEAGITAQTGAAAVFADEEDFSDWEKEAISFVSSAGLVNGMPDGSYNNKGNATRAEAAVVLKRVYDLIEDRQ